jgi:hypothetical protein
MISRKAKKLSATLAGTKGFEKRSQASGYPSGHVFARAHPKLKLEPVGMSQAVAFMVGHAVAVSAS